MTGEHAQEIGQLQAKADNASTSITQLFDSNEKRKAEINAIKLELKTIQHTVEETNQTANRVADFMEDLKKAVNDMKESFDHMNGRVTALEGERFDIVKVLRWFGTTRGLILIVIMIGVLNPASQEFLIKLVNSI